MKHRILGQCIKIEHSSDLPNEEIQAFADIDERRIVLPEKVSELIEKELYYHEFTHTVLMISGLSELLDDKLEEAICTMMGHALSTIEIIED